MSWTCVLWRGLRGGGEGRPRRAGGGGEGGLLLRTSHTHVRVLTPLRPRTTPFRYLLNTLVALLENPNAEDALEAEIGAQMTADMPAFEAEAKSQTAKYAQ